MGTLVCFFFVISWPWLCWCDFIKGLASISRYYNCSHPQKGIKVIFFLADASTVGTISVESKNVGENTRWLHLYRRVTVLYLRLTSQLSLSGTHTHIRGIFLPQKTADANHRSTAQAAVTSGV